MQFHVRILDEAAQTVRTEVVEAANEGEARAVMESRGGMRVLSVTASKPMLWQGLSRPRPARLDVGWWCRELRTLLVAGMTVVEALDTLNAQQLGASRANVNQELARRLAQGQALSVAMQAVGAFPDVLVASVRASERTSNLVEALDDFLRYEVMLSELRKKLVSAAIYPAVVIGLGLSISLFLLLFVVPRFSKMYGDLKGQASGTTQMLVWLSKVLSNHMQWVLLGLACLAGALVWAWRSGAMARVFQQLLAKISPLQRQLDEFRLAKLYHSLALMFRGGFALPEALTLCEGLQLGGRIDQGVKEARQALLQGQGVAATFAAAGLTDTVSRRLLTVGERTGNFDRVLQTIADRHAANFTTFIERTTRLVEPILLLTVALLVGGIVVMMYMPVFDIASSLR